MTIELTVQLVAYAVLITAVVVTLRADSNRNREALEAMRKWFMSHAAEEKENLTKLDAKVDLNVRLLGVAHAEIMKELGRLGGKIDNGGS